MISVTFDGEIFKNSRDKLISVFEARGHAAIRAEQSPHPYFQMSEFLKREQDEQDIHRSRRRDYKRTLDSGDVY